MDSHINISPSRYPKARVRPDEWRIPSSAENQGAWSSAKGSSGLCKVAPSSLPEHRQKLSIIILTLNEEHHIQGALESAKFADEVLVLDSLSTDRTRQRALEFPVVFLQRRFDNFLNQRLYAAQHATHDMIFFLDADERISDELRKEIQDTLKSGKVMSGYKVPFRHYFMGCFLRENRFKESWKLRLLNRKHCTYQERVLVHERAVVCKGQTGKLKHPVWHYTYNSWDQFLKKKTWYATLKAREDFANGIRPNAYHFALKPFWKFVHMYLVRGGFSYGVPGFVGASTSAYFLLMRYVKLWLMRRRAK